MLFFMLRDLIGEAAFDAGMRGFWTATAFASPPGTICAARSSAPRAGSSPASSSNGWSAAAPRHCASPTRGQDLPPPDAFGLDLTLTQATPVYALRVPVEVVFQAGSETREVEVDRERQIVRLALPQPPKGVRLDK